MDAIAEELDGMTTWVGLDHVVLPSQRAPRPIV
jgi:hypothetical protein